MSKQKNKISKDSRAAEQPQSVADKGQRYWHLPRVNMLVVFFLAAWVWASVYYGVVFRICREYSFWVANPDQMFFVLNQPGGPLWYVGRMLLQPFYHPWMGGLLLAVLLTVGSWFCGYLLRLRGRWQWLQFVPAGICVLTFTYLGMDLFFEAETGRIMGIPAAVFVCLLVVAVAFRLVSRRPLPAFFVAPEGQTWKQWSGQLLAVALIFVCSIGFGESRRPYVRIISQLMEAQYRQDWGTIQRVARKNAEVSNRPIAAYYAMALVHTDQICDRLYDIRLEFDTMYVHGMDGLQNTAVSLYIPEGSYHGGFMLTCLHQCMEQMVMTGPTVRLLHLMVKSALMRGEWELAEKYLRVLRDVPFEKSFCQKYGAMVRHPELVDADSEMFKIRMTEPLRDSFESQYQQPTFLGYNLSLVEGRSLNALYNSLAVCLYTKLMPDFSARINPLQGSTTPENVADGILLASNNFPGIEQGFANLNLRLPRLQAFMNAIQPYMSDRAGHAKELFPRYKGYYPYYYFFGNLRATSSKQKGNMSSNSGVN
ncbi:MAG: hypothetical protein II600_07095 [Bacteroidaceae bacterium]|nr:hypothetical protein [Bacteroidaceae bacterium]